MRKFISLPGTNEVILAEAYCWCDCDEVEFRSDVQ